MLGAAALTALGASTALATPSSSKSSSLSAAEAKSLKSSRNLWATIDVCNPEDQPNAVGIRGSMPGDHQAADKMYMSFRLQYLDAKTKRWTAVSKGAPRTTCPSAAAALGARAGASFELEADARRVHAARRRRLPVAPRQAGAAAARRAPRAPGTSAVAGADPAGYSAAECVIG